MHRLLFGEAGAVAAYCLVVRTVALAICKALGLPTSNYIDDFSTNYLLADRQGVDDPWNSVVEVLRFAL